RSRCGGRRQYDHRVHGHSHAHRDRGHGQHHRQAVLAGRSSLTQRTENLRQHAADIVANEGVAVLNAAQQLIADGQVLIDSAEVQRMALDNELTPAGDQLLSQANSVLAQADSLRRLALAFVDTVETPTTAPCRDSAYVSYPGPSLVRDLIQRIDSLLCRIPCPARAGPSGSGRPRRLVAAANDTICT